MGAKSLRVRESVGRFLGKMSSPGLRLRCTRCFRGD